MPLLRNDQLLTGCCICDWQDKSAHHTPDHTPRNAYGWCGFIENRHLHWARSWNYAVKNESWKVCVSMLWGWGVGIPAVMLMVTGELSVKDSFSVRTTKWKRVPGIRLENTAFWLDTFCTWKAPNTQKSPHHKYYRRNNLSLGLLEFIFTS